MIVFGPFRRSLNPECTPLKHAYDSCFNAWFEGYLKPAVVAADQQRKASDPSATATAARPTPAPAASQANALRLSVVGQDPRATLTSGKSAQRDEKPGSISLIPSLAIDPPAARRPRTLIDARGHVVSSKSAPKPAVAVPTEATLPDSTISADAEKAKSDRPAWTNTLFSLFMPTHRAGLSDAQSTSDLSIREDARSHPDLWPFRSFGTRTRVVSSEASGSSKSLHPGIQNEAIEDDDDDDDDGEISPEDVKLVLEEFGEEESATSAAVPLSSEPAEATIINPAKMQAERAQAMRDQYEAKCGGLWKEYRACVQVSGEIACDSLMIG